MILIWGYNTTYWDALRFSICCEFDGYGAWFFFLFQQKIISACSKREELMATQVSTKSSNMICSLFCVFQLAIDFCLAFSFSTHLYLICMYEACSTWLIYSWTNASFSPWTICEIWSWIMESLKQLSLFINLTNGNWWYAMLLLLFFFMTVDVANGNPFPKKCAPKINQVT